MTSSTSAVFVAGVLRQPSRSADPLLQVLTDEFGPRRWHVTYDFDFTDYYHEEHGAPLVRTWHVFDPLFAPGDLKVRKITAMSVEDRFRDEDGDRPFNVDVGYVTGSSFVLASRKNHAHRVTLGDGIHAEVTLRYEDGSWRESPHPYPEFTESRSHDWLHRVRDDWLEEVGSTSP